MIAAVRRILIYPIKSLDPVAVSEATVLASGALASDREFALVDEKGAWVNGKREARIHRLRAGFDLANNRVTLRVSPGVESETFHLTSDRARLEDWFSRYFGFRTRLERNTAGGFPDDMESPGPTIIGSATLGAVGGWFGLGLEEASRRFRANIELDTDEPFWEDRLFSGSGNPVQFQIGSVAIDGVNPCQRCAVPSRDSETGVVLEKFSTGVRRQASGNIAPMGSGVTLHSLLSFERQYASARLRGGQIAACGDTVMLSESL
jgi:uncharacterized protein YcbX